MPRRLGFSQFEIVFVFHNVDFSFADVRRVMISNDFNLGCTYETKPAL
jgi:hypothetical protein